MIATVLPFLRLAARPVLSGPEEVYDVNADFRLHFTREGADTAGPDGDGNGWPDLVDTIARELVVAEQGFAEEGWRALARDDGTGGTDAIDVYVLEIPDYGYTVPAPIGDGTTNDGSSCWVMYATSLVPGPIAASVVAHELHHCVEFRYSTSLASWVYESAATYEQYTHVTDPALDLAAGLLYLERLAATDQKLGTTEGRLEYGAFLWTKFWAERDGGGTEALVRMWEELSLGGGWPDAMGRAATAEHGLSLDELYLEHAVWNAFACAADDGLHYDPAVIPCVVDTAVVTVPWDGSAIEVSTGEAPYTAMYLERAATDLPVAVRCEGGGEIGVALVPRDPNGVSTGVVSGIGGETLQVDGAGGPVTVVVAGTGQDPLWTTCVEVEATNPPAPPEACGCATGRTGLTLADPVFLGIVALVARRFRKTA